LDLFSNWEGKGMFLCPGLVADVFDVSTSEDSGY
jgi:hypothetical protein